MNISKLIKKTTAVFLMTSTLSISAEQDLTLSIVKTETTTTGQLSLSNDDFVLIEKNNLEIVPFEQPQSNTALSMILSGTASAAQMTGKALWWLTSGTAYITHEVAGCARDFIVTNPLDPESKDSQFTEILQRRATANFSSTSLVGELATTAIADSSIFNKVTLGTINAVRSGTSIFIDSSEKKDPFEKYLSEIVSSQKQNNPQVFLREAAYEFAKLSKNSSLSDAYIPYMTLIGRICSRSTIAHPTRTIAVESYIYGVIRYLVETHGVESIFMPTFHDNGYTINSDQKTNRALEALTDLFNTTLRSILEKKDALTVYAEKLQKKMREQTDNSIPLYLDQDERKVALHETFTRFFQEIMLNKLAASTTHQDQETTTLD